MPARARSSNLMKPWKWLTALAAVCLVLASSTALYAINPGVRLDLPWWSAVVAPALLYALVLPLCVPRIRIGGWLIGFVVLAALHLGLGAATAWLYAQVSLVSIEETLAPAFWSFPPALVLEMVGALLTTLPFLSAVAPRAVVPRAPSERIMAEASARREKLDLSALPGTTRQSWARAASSKEPVVSPPASAVLSSGPPPATATVPEVEESSLAAPGEREQTVHAAPLAGKNGSSSEKVEHVTEVASPDFREAVRELLGPPAAEPPTRIEEVLEPLVTVVPEESPSVLTAEEPAWAKRAESASAPEPPRPVAPSAVVRIPFDRVVGQLPPGAFRVPLPQLGARLREPETLLVAHTLIVPQLGEGVVQVAWEEVAGQFPSAVLAVPPAEVKERIVNGRLLLPLDEIIRQLPPDVFGAALGRGPVEVPGLESFPAPFKPMGRSEPALSPAPEPLSHVEPATIDVSSPSQVGVDLDRLTVPAPPEVAVTSVLEPVVPEPAPVVAPPPPSLLEAEVDRTAPSVTLEPPAPLSAHVVEPVHERVAESPAIAAAEPAAEGEHARIPFERVLAQLPPGAFRLPLDQVGARLAEPGVLLVPQALVVSQLAEGAVYAPWETVAAQFPAAVLAVEPADVKGRLEEGRLSLPLDEIIRQLPPQVFGAAMARGPVHVPGIESFPAPFKPIQREEPASAPAPSLAGPAPSRPSVPSPAIAVSETARPEPASSPVPMTPPTEVAAPAPTRLPVAEMTAPPAHEIVTAEAPVAASAPTEELAPPPLVTPTIAVSIVEPPAPIEWTRPRAPASFVPSPAEADSGAVAEAPASDAIVPEPPAALPAAADARRELAALPAPSYADSTPPVEREAAAPESPVPPALGGISTTDASVREAAVLEPSAPFPTVREIVPADAPKEAATLESPDPLPTVRDIVPTEAPAPFPSATEIAPAEAPVREAVVLKPPVPFPSVRDVVPTEVPVREATVPEPPAPFPSMRDVVPTEAPREATVLEPTASFPSVRDIVPTEAPVRQGAVLESPAPFATARTMEPPAKETVLDPPAPLEARDLRMPTPRVSAPVSTWPQPVPVAPLYEARVFERPAPVEPTPPPPARREHVEKIAALMGPFATVAPDETRVGDFTIISAATAGMAAGTVTAAAGRICPIMARGVSHPIEQVTLRGAGGMLVLTPVGSGWSAGATLAVGMRTGGALARLEMLARRAAASPMDREPARGVAPFARLDAAPTPPAIAAAAEDLTSFGPLDAQSYREAAGGAVVHCLVAPGVPAAELAPFAWELAQVMVQSAPAEALGAFHSAVLRSGKTRVEIRKLPAPAGLSQILVVAGSDTGRPGLARLQVERTAARLSEA